MTLSPHVGGGGSVSQGRMVAVRGPLEKGRVKPAYGYARMVLFRSRALKFALKFALRTEKTLSPS